MGPRHRCHIAFPMFLDSVGGSQLATIELARLLKNKNFKVTIVVHALTVDTLCMELSEFEQEHLLLPVISFRQSWIVQRMWGLLVTTFRLYIHLSNNKYDIVHSNEVRSHIAWSLPCKLTGVPHIVHQRTKFSPSLSTLVALWTARKIFAVSEFVKNSIPEKFLEKSERLYDPYTRLTRLVPNNLEEKDSRTIRKQIIFIGKLTRQKNPDLFLRIALDLTALSGGFYNFLVLGEEEYWNTQNLLAIDARYKGLPIKFHGFDSNISRHLDNSIALIALGEDEGFGRVIWEAFSHDVVVIAANSGAFPEIISDGYTGVLVDLKDLDCAAAKVVGVLSDHEIVNQMCSAGRRALSAFSQDYWLDCLVANYRKHSG